MVVARPVAWLREELPDASARRGVLALLASTLTNSVFCRLTVFGSSFILFLDHLGLDKGRIGLLLSLIPFAGLSALVCASFVSRIGFRRAYIAFFAVRKLAIGLLLLLPWVSARWGAVAGLLWVAAMVVVFALCRAIGEVGAYALFQEVIPNAIRGKFGAATYGLVTLSGVCATAFAGWALRGTPDTARYLTVIAVGVGAGVLSVVSLLPVHGGAPVERVEAGPTAFTEMAAALADRNFLRYLTGLGLANLAISLSAFTPLFMKECVGLPPGKVVWLEGAASLGGLAAAGLWGRAADRRGSKPVLLGGITLAAAAPLAMAAPGVIVAAVAALLLMVWTGASQTGWYIGSERYLYVRAVPPERKTGYIAVFYALAGLTNGIGPLAAGWLIDASRALGWHPYRPLFLLSGGLALAAAFALSGLACDRDQSIRSPQA